MTQLPDPYQQNLLALGLLSRQGVARVRRRWIRESHADFDTIEHYSYDEAGALVSLVDDWQRFARVYSYDDAGRIVGCVSRSLDANAPDPPVIEAFFYDASGRIARKTVFIEEPDTESTFTLDALGRISAEHQRHWASDDAATSDYCYHYDSAGRLQSVVETFSRGTSSISTYHYDAQNRLLLIYKRATRGRTVATSYEYQQETPQGSRIINPDFAEGEQLAERLAHE